MTPRTTVLHLLITFFAVKTSSIGMCNPNTDNSILTNENGRYVTNITKCFFPSNESEIISIINQARSVNASVKAIGNGLSFNANGMMDNKSMNCYYNDDDDDDYCAKNHNKTNTSCSKSMIYKHQQILALQSTYILNLTVNMNKIIEINEDTMYAIIEAGVKNVDLLRELDKHNLAVYSYGSPNAMPFISASSTGTHPWGISYCVSKWFCTNLQ